MPKSETNTHLTFAKASAEVLTFFANASRLHILSILVEREISVLPLSKLVGLRQATLSQHLAKLRYAGLVSFRRESNTIYYRCESKMVKKVIAQLDEIFEHDA